MFIPPTASPASIGVGEVAPDLSLATGLVVEVTAEQVTDMIGWDRQRTPWRFSGTCAGMRFGVARHRVHSPYRVTLTGGTITLAARQGVYDRSDGDWRDQARRSLQGLLWADEHAQNCDELDDEVPDAPARVITQWSRRSRARMVKSVADIDHDTWTASGTLGMVTLTLPGRWLDVAPSGDVFKMMLRRFRWRWESDIGPWQTVWKLEFQRRGAPHYHLMMRCPAMVGDQPFEEWLSDTWADVVKADDFWCESCMLDAAHCECDQVDTERARHRRAGTNADFRARLTDPKRIAVYFLKHSSKTADAKEYQHTVPAEWRQDGHGPGRFWGIGGLGRAARTLEVDRHTWVLMRRILRGVHRGQRARTALSRRRHDVAEMSETFRKATLLELGPYGHKRDRILRSSRGGGWILSNDAPALLFEIARYLATTQHRPRLSGQVSTSLP